MTNDEEIKGDLAQWREAFAQRMDKFEKNLDENTAVTQRVDDNTRELVEILSSWKAAMKVMDFLAKLAKPIAAFLALLTAWWAWKSQK